MYQDYFVDFDELILRCRDKRAKQYIAEAVSCYRAGAFRACIVTTWIAVVFDYINKLQELALTGDREAQQHVDLLESLQRNNNLQQSLEFEKKILHNAKEKFELLSTLEYNDLERLYEDRNRCAHPSMLSLTEPYQPPAELARYHLRSAVTHLLQHPPVQGKAALDRIMKDIFSENFPGETDKARELLQHGPLARARLALISNTMAVLIKDLLLGEKLPSAQRKRHYAALNAVIQMYTGTAEEILREKLPKYVQEVEDASWLRVIIFLRRISGAWNVLGEAGRLKAKHFVATCSLSTEKNDFLALGHALYVPELKEIAIVRIPELSLGALTRLIALVKRPEYIDAAIRYFAEADSFNEGNLYATDLLLPLVPLLNADQVTRVVKAFLENGQLNGSSGTERVMIEVFEQTNQYAEATKDVWVEMYEYIGIGGRKRYRIDGTMREGHPLFQLIEERYPEVLDLAKSVKTQQGLS